MTPNVQVSFYKTKLILKHDVSELARLKVDIDVTMKQ